METDKIKLLAIDDKRDNLVSLQAVLRDIMPEAQVLTATNGPHGLEMARTEDPDVILLDIIMPGMDGFEVCRRLKADNLLQSIPVVFLTALGTDRESRIRALEIGADAFLSKPPDEQELLAQIRAMSKVKAANRSQQTEKERLEALVVERTRMVRESESRYRAMFENMASASCVDEIVYKDGRAVDYRILDVNPAYERITGIRRQEAVGALASVLYGLGQAPFLDVYGRVAETGEPAEFEAWLEPIQKHLHVTVGCPKPGFFSTVFTDITKRKQAERNLQEAKDLVDAVVENVPLMIFLKEAQDLRFVVFNKAGEDLLGYDRKDFLGKNNLDLFPPEQAAHFMAKDRETLTSGVALDIPEEKILTAKKGERLLHTRKVCIKGADGVTKYLLGISEDITERKQTEAALKLSEQRYRFSLVSTGQIGWSTPPDGVVEDMPMWREYSGQSLEEVVGWKWLDAVHPDDRESAYKAWSTAAAQKINYFTEYRIKRADGVYRNFMVRGIPLLNADGSCKEWVGTCIDITERKQAETEREKLQSQLTQSQKMEAVGQLAGGVAHDFNNMLSVINGYSELLLLGIDPSDPKHAHVKEILRAGERSADLTRQLLAFARKQSIAPQVLDVNETITNMLKMLQRLIGENISLSLNLASNLWKVEMDPTQVNQILANLLVNARDAISGVGKVEIETRNCEIDEEFCRMHPDSAPGRYVLIRVGDNGCGMGKETIKHIFEPFFTTKKIGEGTGLGLATVFGIVKQNNGFINVDSEPGKGTTFGIYLPWIDQGSAGKDVKPEKQEILTGTETVLIVEDETAVLKIASKMLEQLGYTVLTADSPEKGIKVSGEYKGEIHLLLTDVIMPGMSGREVRDKITAMRPGIRCLFMSGYTADIISKNNLLEKGIHSIEKPFTPATMSRKLREALCILPK